MLNSEEKIGKWSSVSLVLGNMIGSGIFLLPASLAAFGGISIFGWLISSLGALILAQVFVSFSKKLPKSGGPYAYVRAGMGDFFGFLVAWGYWVSILCTNAAITVAMLGYLNVFFPILGDQPIIAVIVGIAIIWLLTWVNSKGVRSAGYVQLITTILKVIPLILVAIVGLLVLKIDHFQPMNISGLDDWDAIIQTTTLTLFAFLGIESATIPAESTDDASSVVPKATWIGTIIAVVIYMASSTAVMGIIPPAELQYSTAPFSDAAKILFGNGAEYWIAAGAVVSTFGALNGWILMQGQIPMAIARDNLFPSFFSKLNKHQVPGKGIIVSSIFVCILMSLNYTKGLNKAFEFMILMSTLTVLIPYLLSSISFMILHRDNARSVFLDWNIWIGFGALAFSLFAIIGSGMDVFLWGSLLLIAGIPIYWYRINRKKS